MKTKAGGERPSARRQERLMSLGDKLSSVGGRRWAAVGHEEAPAAPCPTGVEAGGEPLCAGWSPSRPQATRVRTACETLPAPPGTNGGATWQRVAWGCPEEPPVGEEVWPHPSRGRRRRHCYRARSTQMPALRAGEIVLVDGAHVGEPARGGRWMVGSSPRVMGRAAWSLARDRAAASRVWGEVGELGSGGSKPMRQHSRPVESVSRSPSRASLAGSGPAIEAGRWAEPRRSVSG